MYVISLNVDFKKVCMHVTVTGDKRTYVRTYMLCSVHDRAAALMSGRGYDGWVGLCGRSQ